MIGRSSCDPARRAVRLRPLTCAGSTDITTQPSVGTALAHEHCGRDARGDATIKLYHYNVEDVFSRFPGKKFAPRPEFPVDIGYTFSDANNQLSEVKKTTITDLKLQSFGQFVGH